MKYLLTLLLLSVSVLTKSNVRLPAIIGDHMVLQQNSMVNLWGWSDPTENITVRTSWDTTSYKTVGSEGAKWMVQIQTPSAGGPYTITIKGNNEIVINDVLIGEVWLCSGQSNMEMHYNWGLKQYTEDMNKATNQSIRFFHIPKLTSDHPQDNTVGKWVVCNPQDAKNFSLVGYYFGSKINSVTRSPVGLINASWGGTPAETWTPAEVVEEDPVLREASTKLNKAQWWPITPAATYNAMIYPIVNFGIGGAIWYQGEANTTTSSTYQSLLTKMIDSWRSAFKREFPFYFVQIAPFAYGTNHIGPLLREAQSKAASHKGTGMIVISDLVDNVKDIHPQMKKEVGLRLANYALGDHYKADVGEYRSPVFKSMEVAKNKIRISFEHAQSGLISKGGAPTEFYIAGDDKKFYPATARIIGNKVEVSAKEVKQPVAVRFGFANEAMPNLFNKEGLPVDLFRTDNWPL